MKITSYFLDEDGTLHTYIGKLKHVTIENVKENEIAELIEELNENLEE